MSNTPKLNLCIPSTGHEEDWRRLYEAAFPADERMSLSEVQSMLDSNRLLLHRTLDDAGNLLSFSIVTPMSNFALLAYIATDQTRRSSGVGSKHMRELISIIRTRFPQNLGLFLEIESTTEVGLSLDEKVIRQRRLSFYEKLGAKRLIGKDYLLPSYLPGTPPRQGELLWFEHTPTSGEAQVQDKHLGPVICEIYTRGYGVSPGSEQLARVMKQFPDLDLATCNQFPVTEPKKPEPETQTQPEQKTPSENETILRRLTRWFTSLCERLFKTRK